MKSFFLLIILFLISSPLLGTDVALPQLDPNKFTVCTMTINSDNERAVFEAEIKKSPQTFNPIVELTTFGEDDWFDKACASGVRCDQLVISGHFGGTFFGSSGKSLPLSELEKKGCSKSCEGILSQPYEVFLMGCNTLASKDADHRTPEQYLQVLLGDGFNRADAEMVVESRYGSTGDDNRSKMQRAFGGEKKQLYGFSSVGPSGKNVEGFLKNYFKKSDIKKRLEHLQAKRLIEKVDFANKELASTLKQTAFAQCATGSLSGDIKTKLICGLRDSRKSAEERVALVREAFSQENYLTYIPSINDFLIAHPEALLSEEIKAITNNPVIKNKILDLIEKTKSFVIAKDWITLATKLNFIDKDKEREHYSSFVKRMFEKPISINDRDLLCSLSKETKPKIIIREDFILGRNLQLDDYKALACLPNSLTGPNVQLIFADGLHDQNWRARYEVAQAFRDIKPSSVAVQLKLIEGLEDEIHLVRTKIAEAFQIIKPQNIDVQLKLVEELDDSHWLVRAELATVFEKTKPQSVDVQLKLIEHINDPDMNVRIAIVNAFKEIKPQNLVIQQKLIEGLEDGFNFVRIAVANAFTEIKPQSIEIQLKLVEKLTDDSSDFRWSVIHSLMAIKPTNQEVLQAIQKIDPNLYRELTRK